MGTFTASLKTMGDRTGLPATVRLEDGRLTIAAGEQQIGDWSLEDIELEPIPTGYRMAAEGEQILLELADLATFATELDRSTKTRRARSKTKEKTGRKPRSESTTPSDEKTQRDETRPEDARGPSVVDRALAAARRRLGSYLPAWMFTRPMLVVLLAVLLLTVFLPGLISLLLLLTGLVVVILGAIVYTDQMLASKWLPGRMTPTQVLLIGVTIVMLGVLLGVVSG